MDKVVDKAKSLGGDGIVCFNIKYYPPTKSSQAYYQATGVAVKVKKYESEYFTLCIRLYRSQALFPYPHL